MRKIKVIQVGTLHDHAIFTFRSLMRNTDCFEVVGLCIPDENERARLECDEAKSEYIKVPILTLEQALSFKDLEGAVIESAEANGIEHLAATYLRNHPPQMPTALEVRADVCG